MSKIELDMDVVKTCETKLGREALRLSESSGSLTSTMYQLDGAIGSRRSIRLRLEQSAFRILEIERRLRELNTFVHSAQEQYSGLERMLELRAQELSRHRSVHQGQSGWTSTSHGVPPAQSGLMAVALLHAVQWMSLWLKQPRPPLIASLQPSRNEMYWSPYDPENHISMEDIKNRDDPDEYARLMAGRYGRMTEAERQALIEQVEKFYEDEKKQMEPYTYGRTYASGFGHGIETAIQGIIDLVKTVAQHPGQTLQAAWEGAVELVSDPIGAAKAGIFQVKETLYDFKEGGPGKKGHYAGEMFVGVVAGGYGVKAAKWMLRKMKPEKGSEQRSVNQQRDESKPGDAKTGKDSKVILSMDDLSDEARSKITISQQATLNLHERIYTHVTPDDLLGAEKELKGIPLLRKDGSLVLREDGLPFNHMQEVSDSYRGLEKLKKSYKGILENPNLDSELRQLYTSKINEVNASISTFAV